MAARIQFEFPQASDPAFRGFPLGIPTGGPSAWLRAAIARWRQRRILEELDDRVLHDIGISRSQALAEAGKPFWRE